MEKRDLIGFCVEENILLDNDLINIFSNYSNIEKIKSFIRKLKELTQKKFITKDFLHNDLINLKDYFLKDSQEYIIFEDLSKNLLAKELQNKEEKKINLSNKFSSKVKIINSYSLKGKNFNVKDFVGYFRNRFNTMKSFLENNTSLTNLISINRLNGSKQNISLIGMISKKTVTKNKNLIFEVEDLTGKTKVLISKSKEELYSQAEEIPLDSVVGFRCSGSKEMLFCNEVIYPDSVISSRKKSPIEEFALFIGDLHFGSKNFLKKSFEKFIDYLNGKFGDEEVSKIKYLFVIGDIVTGVGNYPHQEKDLLIGDLEAQFKELANLLGKIRKDIKIIISPGNHDGVRLMEPQPIFDEKYAWPLYELENVILVSNPSLVNIGEYDSFEGLNVLMYHGFSFPFYANNVSSLILAKAMNKPELIIKYLLKFRHLAPTHGSVQYYPSGEDLHIIKKIPDIFFAGHTHKAGLTYYNNILIISSATWESFTPYQEKFGNKPDYCKVTMVNLKTRAIKILDFEDKEELEEIRNANRN